MPKITDTKTKATPKYQTAAMPEDRRENESHTTLNLQICSCGHDRCLHTFFLGTGEARRIILDCPNAGACRMVGCQCGAFVFDEKRTGQDGNKRRETEKRENKVVPPVVK